MGKISHEQLTWRCPEEYFDSASSLYTYELLLGQDRAKAAIGYGLKSRSNMFIIDSGIDRNELVRFCKAHVPNSLLRDLVYVNDFDVPNAPKIIAVPFGKSTALVNYMEELVSWLSSDFATEFLSCEYTDKVAALSRQYEKYSAYIMELLEGYAKRHGSTLTRDGVGFSVSGGNERAVKVAVSKALSTMREHAKKTKTWTDRIKLETGRKVLEARLANAHSKFPEMRDYFEALIVNALTHLDELVEPGTMFATKDRSFLDLYKVNSFVRNDTDPPVVYEDNATYGNLFGKIEYVFQNNGVPVTDVTRIVPGSLHKAVGGVIIIDAYSLLTSPNAWAALARSIQSGQIKLNDTMEAFRTTHFTTLDPEGIPLDVTVILVGPAQLYSLLVEKEPAFKSMVSVVAEGASVVKVSPRICSEVGMLISTLCSGGCEGVTSKAMAKCVEQAVRQAGDRNKIDLSALRVLVPECVFYSQGKSVTAACVSRAVAAIKTRSDAIEHEIRDRMLDETLLIGTSGRVTGQINALAVVTANAYMFGTVLRVTANVYVGAGEVINVEREVKLSGNSYDKGVFILTSYLKNRFAKEKKMSLGVSICMEQMLNKLDGDSASAAELFAVLSAITDIPITQEVAVTGSVNQKGEIQAIGGVTQKIEGFFDLCKARELTGRQGVLIPSANVKNLMLKDEVIEAVAEGMFTIWGIETVNEGFKLLTGLAEDIVTAKGLARLERLREDKKNASL